ncbi:RNA cap guanine-N2 methyltransferase-domain-containing protein [Hysterangium stoloniferum]|nr:RNA cap guanine-N2 methyltransferase-domain-containing protein [Hysterangium stoloniferum]
MGKSKNRQPRSLLAGLPPSVLESIRSTTASTQSDPTVIGIKRSADSEIPVSTKKQKSGGLLGPGWAKYDASNLVSFYTEEKDVPKKLKKYFYQRERYFSLYDQGCLLDEEGWYSVTPEGIADAIAERCRCGTIVDAFCGVGGNAIAFARTCERVIAIDTSETRLRLARHNAAIYGVQDRIDFILGDYVSFAKAYLTLPAHARTTVDVVFLSPPWGGVDYTSSPQKTQNGDVDEDLTDGNSYCLDRIKPLPGSELFHLSRGITLNVAYYLPKHVNLKQVSELIPQPQKTVGDSEIAEKIEVQEAWMGNKLKAVTCYFGGLVDGQEHLFPA